MLLCSRTLLMEHPFLRDMRILRRYLLLFATAISGNIFAQAPNISYSPSTAVLTLNTAMTVMTPSNSGGPVAGLAYGTGSQLSGATLNNPYGLGIDALGNI